MGPAHFAIAFAVKPAAPKVPLGVLLVAAEVIDLLCFGFIALGIENAGVSRTDISQGVSVISPASVPWSHGLFMSVVWSLAAAAVAFLVYRQRRASAVVGLVVFSHWVLDFIVHPPDLPLLFGGSPMVGLGLWTSGPGLILSGLLEVALLAGGVAIYAVARKRKAAQTRAENMPPE
jgi:hypothetical protein